MSYECANNALYHRPSKTLAIVVRKRAIFFLFVCFVQEIVFLHKPALTDKLCWSEK